ncbi:TetR/AcrR family transcriptional regulator [Clostridium sporogenes]|uniref:TetR/AcrR family transcriptional regulator n=1 Tax=Clostridium sporogenes TaxID=1509 RepID=UPI002901A3A7|nr:TetR/AcrR family transcriptional regulator [Clostridium botulinum]
MPKETFFYLPKEKQDRIINSSILQFSKVHYNKVTIDSIVEGAKIPKGSFYQYFKNKDDLYEYIFSQIGDEKKELIENLRKNVGKINFKEYVIMMLQEGQKYEEKDVTLLELKSKFINQCPQELRKKILKNEIPKSYLLIEDIITAYINKGELRKNLKVDKAAYIITSCIISLENYEGGENFEEIISDILDILINGMK